jgi:hypothetical protein
MHLEEFARESAVYQNAAAPARTSGMLPQGEEKANKNSSEDRGSKKLIKAAKFCTSTSPPVTTTEAI